MNKLITEEQIDVAVATAKKFPRNEAQCVLKARSLALMDKETAAECFYTLRRGGQIIEGISVRMAEIIAHCWGNIHAGARIVSNDGKWITAVGECRDLEMNNTFYCHVARRITDKNGNSFSEDMQTVAGNAACSIAFRNAVLKAIPQTFVKSLMNEVKAVALGQMQDVKTSRAKCLQWFADRGVMEHSILTYLDVRNVNSIDAEMVIELRSLAKAVKEGATTIEEVFSTDEPAVAEVEQKTADKAHRLMEKSKEAKKRAMEAQSAETVKEEDK